jgi:hypothetical protein
MFDNPPVVLFKVAVYHPCGPPEQIMLTIKVPGVLLTKLTVEGAAEGIGVTSVGNNDGERDGGRGNVGCLDGCDVSPVIQG